MGEMMFEGRKIKPTVRNVGDETAAIAKSGDVARAASFVDAYAAWQESEGVKDARDVAMQNIGYIAGYYESETHQKILEVFNTAHPVFGTTIPSPREAFDAAH